jgi:hypothetical protein
VIAALHARQQALARNGLVMAAIMALCLVAMLFDVREIRGVSVWVKPAKFAASLAVWCWTMAWAWAALDPAWRAGPVARAIVVGTIACGGFEVGWITLRAALGMPSHFANDALGAMVYSAMGLAAVLLCLCAAVFGALVAWRGDAAMDRAMRLAIAAGFVVAGVLGIFTGLAIGGGTGPYVGSVASDAGAWPPFFWSRSGGDLRIAHFLAIHAMQALPLLAWALRRAGAAAPRRWIALGTAGWVGLTLGAFALARAGVAL